jgi:peptide/nickel transport system ATP-binding protein
MSGESQARIGAAPALLEMSGLHVQTAGGRTLVRDVELEVNPGEAVGIVGESGSGKSMTAKALMGLLPPAVEASGEIRFGGRNLIGLRERQLAKIRGGEIGLVMQDPFTMLNPLQRCGLQVTEGLRRDSGRSLSRADRREEAVRRLHEVGIRDEKVAELFPFELSGGMRQRVGIAAALVRDPVLLIADEPSTALDVTTQKEILGVIRNLQASRGMGLILITHDLRVAIETCNRIYVMYAGSIMEAAPAETLQSRPGHPYTQGLLTSEPPADRRLKRLPVIEGSVPQPDQVAHECAFAQRCRWVRDECTQAHPPLRAVDRNRATACLRSEEIDDDLRARLAPKSVVESSVASPGSDLAISVRNLSKVFTSQHGETAALKDVSLSVGAGESVGLVGESGSGKTTLGRCVVGLETPSGGTIEVQDVDVSNVGRLSRADRSLWRNGVQMVFQDPYSSLNPVRTVGATLSEAFAAREHRRPKTEDIAKLLIRVGLPSEYAQRKPAALSGGERQRVAIARALAMRPSLIVCDEPVSALDVSVQAQVLNLLTDLREEFAVSYLFITHDLAVVRQVAERLYVLYHGEIVETGPTAQVLSEPKHAYTKELISSIPGAGHSGEARAPAESSSSGQ